MTAIEDDLTRVLRTHGADVTSYDAGEINGCMCDDLDLIHVDHEDRWAKYDAHIAAVLAPIVAKHVAAGQERALLHARQVVTQCVSTAELWRYERVCWAFAVILGEIPEDSWEPHPDATASELEASKDLRDQGHRAATYTTTKGSR